jgi:hypothetical protein
MAAGGDAGSAEFKGETTAEGIPVIDLSLHLNRASDEAAALAESRRCAEAFHRFGIICVRDPRVSSADNDRCVAPQPPARRAGAWIGARDVGLMVPAFFARSFLDELENYFDQPREVLMEDVRAELSCVRGGKEVAVGAAPAARGGARSGGGGQGGAGAGSGCEGAEVRRGRADTKWARRPTLPSSLATTARGCSRTRRRTSR